jgi:hypothetical protein
MTKDINVKIYGSTVTSRIPGATIDAAWASLAVRFVSSDLEYALRDRVPDQDKISCYRAADRILQNKRKAGEAIFRRPNWEKISK